MTSSIFNLQTLAEFNGLQYSPCGAIFAVDGTAYPGAPGVPGPGAGFSSDIVYGLINAQDGLWESWLIAYPAQTFPMGASVDAGVGVLTANLLGYASSYYAKNKTYKGMAIVLSGYSQGAMITDTVYRSILDPTSSLGFLQPYLYRMYNFGDPYRCPGIAHGNELAGDPLPPDVDGYVTGGIGGSGDLTSEESNILAPDGKYIVNSFVNPGDLYADCPVGSDPWHDLASVARVEHSIFNIIQKATFLDVFALAEDFFMPIGLIEAIINGLTFFSQGMSAPHYHYGSKTAVAVSDCLALGNSLPHMSAY